MACTTTSSYKENIYNSDIEQTISVIINNKTVDPSFVKAIKYDDKIFEVESISIGNAVAREIQLELSNQFTEEFTEVSLSSTLHIETPETLALGTYMVVEKDNSNDYYTKYILHDYMEKFHKKYDASSMVPCTRFALLQSICNYCGVELENSSIINGDVIVNTYDNTIEALEYVRCIAERAAGNAKITRYNKLRIKELNTNENIILPNEMVGDYSYDDQKTITKVIFENAIQKFEKGNNTGECICLSQYSPFSCTQEEVNNIFQSLNGLTYQSLKARIWGDPSVDAGDRLTYGNIKSFAQMSWQWGNGFYGEYDCSLKTNQQTSLVEKLSNSQKIRRIKSILDESNMQIDLLLEENDENSKQISAINLSLEGISSTVNSTTQTVKNLEDSIDYFSVDLSQYNLTIPTDSANKPIETKQYNIPFYAYLKGKQVTPTVTIQNTNTGITAGKTGTYLSFAVTTSTSITKTLNEYDILFQFTDKATTYSLTKKVTIALAKAGANGEPGKNGTDGKDGVNGLSAYQIWLNAGNSGTEADYLASLKGAPGTPGSPGKDGTSTYFYVRYSANSNGNPMVTTPSSTTKYMGVASTTSSTAPTSYSAYTWSLIKGADGENGKDGIDGTPGKDGENGLTSYLHIKYSQDGVAFTEAIDGYALGEKPSAWIGQYVDYTKEDSTNFDDYTWYKFTEDIDEDLGNMKEEIDQANENASNNYTEIVQLKTDIAQTDEKIDFNVQQLSQTIVNNNQNLQNEINDINSNITNGVETLRNTLVTINIDGIKVATNISKISTIMTNDTFAVMSGTTRLAYFGYDEEAGRSIAEMDNLTVKNYFTAGYHRTEGFEDEETNEPRTGWFYVGGDI